MANLKHGAAPLRWPLLGATVNLFIAAAGAGLLSYPYAMLQQGIGLTILLTVVFAAVNCYTDLVLAATAFRVRRLLVALTYEEVCLRVLGPWGYVGAVATVIVGCLGVLIGFFIITADLAQPVVQHLCDVSGGSDACDVVAHRAFILLVFAVIVALPLSSCEHIHSLCGSSVVAALTVIAVGVLVVAKGAEAMAGGPELALCVGASASESPFTDGSTLWFNVSWQAVLGVPLMVFALGNHVQAPNVFLELGRLRAPRSSAAVALPSTASAAADGAGWRTDPGNPQLRFHVAAGATMAACAVLYALTGAFGYLACGAATKGDILLNFPVTDAITAVARALMAVHVVFALPVVVLPCRKAILMLAFFLHARCCTERGRRRASASGRGAAAAAPSAIAPDDSGVSGTSHPRWVDPHADIMEAYLALESRAQLVCGMGCSGQHVALNAALVIGPALVAVAIPQVQVVFGLLGSTISVLKIYVFPAAMLLARARQLDALAPARGSADDKQALLATSIGAAASPPTLSTLSGAGALAATEAAAAAEPSCDTDAEELAEAAGETSRLVQRGGGALASGGGLSPRARLPRAVLPAYIPSSPLWLRVQGCALLVLAGVIGVLGTTSNIYSTAAPAHR